MDGLGHGQGHKARGKQVSVPSKHRELDTSLGCWWVLACPIVRLLLQMKGPKSFQCPLEVEANEVAKIFGLLKVYIPREIELDGLSGKELFASGGNFEEELASDLVDLNPYMKKSSLESALQLMDQENKGMLSQGVCLQDSGPRGKPMP